MGMKPVGKAIVFAVVAVGVIAGVHFSGALNKLEARANQPPAEVQQQAAPAVDVAPVAQQPPPIQQAAPQSDTPPDAALDALINKAAKK